MTDPGVLSGPSRPMVLGVGLVLTVLSVVAGVLVIGAADDAGRTGGPDAVALPDTALAPGVLAYVDTDPIDPVPTPSGLDRFITVIDRRPGSPTYGRVQDLRPSGERIDHDITCDRYHERRQVAVCLELASAVTGTSDVHTVTRSDDGLDVVASRSMVGTPSRVRVSPDGRRYGFTTFVAGHGYGDPGSLSTFTGVFDHDDNLWHMEMLRVSGPDGTLDSQANNFWGASWNPAADGLVVTMTDASDNDGEFHLVRVDPDRLTGEAIGHGECPSWSPDGSTIVVKDRLELDDGSAAWRLVAIDVATGERTVLPEARSVDDQVEWYDDHTILYAVAAGGSALEPRRDLYALRVDDPMARPVLVAAGADSPSAPTD